MPPSTNSENSPIPTFASASEEDFEADGEESINEESTDEESIEEDDDTEDDEAAPRLIDFKAVTPLDLDQGIDWEAFDRCLINSALKLMLKGNASIIIFFLQHRNIVPTWFPQLDRQELEAQERLHRESAIAQDWLDENDHQRGLESAIERTIRPSSELSHSIATDVPVVQIPNPVTNYSDYTGIRHTNNHLRDTPHDEPSPTQSPRRDDHTGVESPA